MWAGGLTTSRPGERQYWEKEVEGAGGRWGVKSKAMGEIAAMPVHLGCGLALPHLAFQVRPGKGRPLAESGLGIPGRCGEEPRGTEGPGETWPGSCSMEPSWMREDQRQWMGSEVGLAVLAFKVSEWINSGLGLG